MSSRRPGCRAASRPLTAQQSACEHLEFSHPTHKVNPTNSEAPQSGATRPQPMPKGKKHWGSISDEEALMFALCSTSKVGIAEALTDCTGDVP
jgi:hypothetical protein